MIRVSSHAAWTLAALAALASGCAASPPPAPPTPAAAPRAATGPARLAPPGLTVAASRHADANPAVAEEEPPRSPGGRPLVPAGETRAVVLLYHGFDRGTDPLSVSSSAFDRQLEWLEQNDVELVSTSELVELLHGERWLPARVAVITIDDGMSSVYERAWPVLRRRGAKFTLGLPSAMVDEPRHGLSMGWDRVREMVASGLCEIASHGHRHRNLTRTDARRTAEELVVSRDRILRETGVEPIAYFFPLGAHDERSRAAVRAAGYRAAFTASGAPIAAGSTDPFAVPRTGIFHGDGIGRFAWYFGDAFLDRVALGAR